MHTHSLGATILACTLLTAWLPLGGCGDDDGGPGDDPTPTCQCQTNEWCDDNKLCWPKDCDTDEDCAERGAHYMCDTADHSCKPRPCTADDDACGDGAVCDVEAGQCQPRCDKEGGECEGGQRCDTDTGRCVPGCSETGCEEGEFCNSETELCAEGCDADEDCGGDTAACHPEDNVCVECNQDRHCTTGMSCQQHVCECVPSCGERQRCDKEVGRCVDLTCPDEQECREGELCDPDSSLCMEWDCLTPGLGGCDEMAGCDGGWCYCDEEHECARHACLADGDCAAALWCDLETVPHVCFAGCRFDVPDACPLGQVCDLTHACVPQPCERHEQCVGEGEITFFCDDVSGTCQLGCASNEDCTNPDEVCNPANHRCVGGLCETDRDCGPRREWPESRFCDLSTDPPTCQQGCRDAQDCPATWPCLADLHICGCRNDADCPDGVCRDLACEARCQGNEDCPQGFTCDDEGHCVPGCLADDFEPNDRRDECQPVDELPWDEVLSLCGSAADEDWFCLDVASEGTELLVTATAEAADLPLVLELWDADARRLATGEAAVPGTMVLEHEALSEGQVALRVLTAEFVDGNYSLEIQAEEPWPCPADELEPNDTRQAARAPEAGRWYDLTYCEGEEDWLALPMRAGDGLSATLEFEGASGWLVAEIWHPDAEFGAALAASDNEEGQDGASVALGRDQVLQHGDYYVRVRSLQREPDSLPYRLRVDIDTDLPLCRDDALEGGGGNDASEQAAAIASGQHDGLTLCMLDEDWFRVAVGEGATLRVTTTRQADGAQNNMVVELYDPAGQRVDRSAEVGPNNSVSLNSADAGEYRVRVAHPPGREAEEVFYSMLVQVEGGGGCEGDDRFEDNDELAEPAALGELVPLPAHNDFANLHLCAGDHDYYLVDLSVDGADRLTVTANFGHAAGDLDIELLDEAGDLACPVDQCSADSSDDNEILATGQLAPGVYLLHVYAFSPNDANDYTLRLDLERGGCEDDGLEPNDESGDGTPMVMPSYREELMLCAGDQDWFQVVTNAPLDLRVYTHFFHFAGDLNLFVFDGDSMMLNDVISPSPLAIEGMSTNNDECVIERDAPMGVYYIQVVGADQRMEALYDIDIASIGPGDGCPEFWPH